MHNTSLNVQLSNLLWYQLSNFTFQILIVFSLNWLGVTFWSCLHWDHFDQFGQSPGFFQIKKSLEGKDTKHFSKRLKRMQRLKFLSQNKMVVQENCWRTMERKKIRGGPLEISISYYIQEGKVQNWVERNFTRMQRRGQKWMRGEHEDQVERVVKGVNLAPYTSNETHSLA
jgi:hypothetical protein